MKSIIYIGIILTMDQYLVTELEEVGSVHHKMTYNLLKASVPPAYWLIQKCEIFTGTL